MIIPDYKIRNINILIDSVLDRLNDIDSIFSMTLFCGKYEIANIHRAPTTTEMLYEANIKLMSYGAKALALYRYFGADNDTNFTGLVNYDSTYNDPETGHYRYTDRYWFVRNTLAPRLRGWFGKTLRSISQTEQIPAMNFDTRYNFIERISYNACGGHDFPSPVFDLGFFTKDSKDYFMIVSRYYNTVVCPLDIKIHYMSNPFNNYRVTDFIDSTVTTITDNGFI